MTLEHQFLIQNYLSHSFLEGLKQNMILHLITGILIGTIPSNYRHSMNSNPFDGFEGL